MKKIIKAIGIGLGATTFIGLFIYSLVGTLTGDIYAVWTGMIMVVSVICFSSYHIFKDQL